MTFVVKTNKFTGGRERKVHNFAAFLIKCQNSQSKVRVENTCKQKYERKQQEKHVKFIWHHANWSVSASVSASVRVCV